MRGGEEILQLFIIKRVSLVHTIAGWVFSWIIPTVSSEAC